MPAPKLQTENISNFTMNVDVAQGGLVHTFGRSSPPYGLVTTMTQGQACLEFNLAPIDEHACATMFAISESDPFTAITGAIDSPCIGASSTTFDDVCIGCGRTAAEVAQWAVMTDDQKQLVWQRIVFKGLPCSDKRNPPT